MFNILLKFKSLIWDVVLQTGLCKDVDTSVSDVTFVHFIRL